MIYEGKMKSAGRPQIRKIKFLTAIFINLLLTGAIIAVIFIIVSRGLNGYQLKQSEDGFYEIYDARDFRLFLQSAYHLEKGRLMKDIYLNESTGYENWITQPPDNRMETVENFHGILDGNGYALYGLYSENGFGLFRVNYGSIENLAIKESVIKGRTMAGGICNTNHGTIRECHFDGIVYGGNSLRECENLSGFCIMNLSDGVIENCGFRGSLAVEGEVYKAAGISSYNTGKIINCYNLSDKAPSGNRRYGITDSGTYNCYVKADTEWMRPESGGTAALSAEELLYLSYYIDGNWNGLWRAKQNLSSWQAKALAMIRDEAKIAETSFLDSGLPPVNLNDTFVSEIICTLLGNQELTFTDICFWPEGNTGRADFSLQLQCAEEDIQIDGYSIIKEIYEDYDKLWEECALILDVNEEETWEHKTWTLEPGENAMAFKTPGKIMVYRYKEAAGLFFFSDKTAYQITFSESSCQDMFDEMAVFMKSLAEGKTSWDEKLSGWQVITAALCRGMEQGDGVLWTGEEKDAVYRRITLDDNFLVCVEDIKNLESILFYHVGLKNLDFVKDMESLDTITAYGCGLENLSALLEGGDKLIRLYLYDNRISDISVLSSCNHLRQINLEDNYVRDISPLKNLDRLEVLNISGNPVKDFTPVSEMKHLYRLRVSEEQLQDIDDFIYIPYIEVSDYGRKLIPWEKRKQAALNQLEAVLGKRDCKVTDVSMKDLNGDKMPDLTVLTQEEEETWLYVFIAEREEKYNLFHSGGLGLRLSNIAEIYISENKIVILDDVRNYSVEGTRRIIVCEYSDGGISQNWETRLHEYVFGLGEKFEILNFENNTYEQYYIYDIDGDGLEEKTAAGEKKAIAETEQ